jgi:hypothetical protein
MTDGSNVPPPPVLSAEGPPPAVERDGGFSINEDWAATLFGIVLLLLVLAGVITGQFMKGLIP